MTKSAVGSPLTITLQIPTDWTPEQAFAVFQFLDDLREVVWLCYAQQIQDQYRDYVSPPPDDLAEQDQSDLPF
jgi:hypothetical protein